MAACVAKQAVRVRRPAVSARVPILASKIAVPNTPGWAVQRPRIAKLIAEGTQWCQLTAVTGPAGAGKTMTLSLRAAAEPGPVAWVSLDEFDNQRGSSGPMSSPRCARPASRFRRHRRPLRAGSGRSHVLAAAHVGASGPEPAGDAARRGPGDRSCQSFPARR